MTQSFWAGSGPEGSADHRPAGGQRSTGPPDVQCADVAMADGLLPAGMGADLLDGKVDLDEALGVLSHCESNRLLTLTYLRGPGGAP